MVEANKISIQYIKVEYTGGYKGMRYMFKKSGDETMEVSGLAGTVVLRESG